MQGTQATGVCVCVCVSVKYIHINKILFLISISGEKNLKCLPLEVEKPNFTIRLECHLEDFYKNLRDHFSFYMWAFLKLYNSFIKKSFDQSMCTFFQFSFPLQLHFTCDWQWLELIKDSYILMSSISRCWEHTASSLGECGNCGGPAGWLLQKLGNCGHQDG